MKVVTTSSKQGLEDYGFRWLESRKNWPKGTEFVWYTEGFEVDCPSKDFRDIPELPQWKLRHAGYRPPSWEWDVVKFSHKVFAAIDALYDHDGVGVWLDADCVTHKKIPKGLIEKQVEGVYMACYQRTGMYTETGLWIVDCTHPIHKQFMDTMKAWYLTDEFKKLPAFHDCYVLDATIAMLQPPIKNLSGVHHKSTHPQALSELGKYLDHAKGGRKIEGRSPENKYREAA